jgi:hypothetical protein
VPRSLAVPLVSVPRQGPDLHDPHAKRLRATLQSTGAAHGQAVCTRAPPLLADVRGDEQAFPNHRDELESRD